MRKYIFLPVFLLAALVGCATTDDLKKVQSDLDQKITDVVNNRVAVVEKKVAAVEEENLPRLKAEDNAIRGEVTRNFEAVTALRKSTAESGADITDIRDTIQQLRGQVEALRKDLATAATHANRKDDEYKEIREKLNNTLFKINFIENFLGIGKKEDQPEGTEKGEKPKDAKGKPDRESAYAAAYELFKDGKFDKAREAFQNFLKQYTDTEYSDNAQFWIGECYYFEKKYENAILEYEKVAKNYPDGDKVPYALLKQGIAFLNLGDKASAKLILQRVIKDYPNTNQARTAKATLLNIK